MTNPEVVAVSKSPVHALSKQNESAIELLEGLGVKGDVHSGKFVKHRSRVKKDPTQPNLRQVHLIHSELFGELKDQGFELSPGMMGENITTIGIDLLALPTNALLRFGAEAEIRITGLRNPCSQLDGLKKGLMKATISRDGAGQLIRKAGVMGVVLKGGLVRPNDPIEILLPPEPHQPLEKV